MVSFSKFFPPLFFFLIKSNKKNFFFIDFSTTTKIISFIKTTSDLKMEGLETIIPKVTTLSSLINKKTKKIGIY